MSNNQFTDPFSVWKKLYDQTEQQWGKVLGETVQSEAFSAWLGYLQKQMLEYQDAVRKSTEKYLEQAHLPSKNDLANLASLIVNLETKVDDLDVKLDQLQDQLSEVLKQKTE